MMKWLFLFFIISPVRAGSITPRFTTGQMESSSRSVQTIVETVVTQNFRSGYSYQAQGSGIKLVTGQSISPDAIYTESQSAGGVSFRWVTPDIDNKPQWTLANPGSGDAFSLVENFLAPGLDAVSTVQRTINTETTQTSLSIFSH
tara:strand:+ start:8499 stop:8933 length:435 start_codon:yes stop_codon:yes gene_type:complete